MAIHWKAFQIQDKRRHLVRLTYSGEICWCPWHCLQGSRRYWKLVFPSSQAWLERTPGLGDEFNFPERYNPLAFEDVLHVYAMNGGWNQHQLICRYKETIDKILAESWQKIEVGHVVLGVIVNQWWIQRLRKMKPWRLIWWTTTRTRSSSLTQSLTQISTRLVGFCVQKIFPRMYFRIYLTPILKLFKSDSSRLSFNVASVDSATRLCLAPSWSACTGKDTCHHFHFFVVV